MQRTVVALALGAALLSGPAGAQNSGVEFGTLVCKVKDVSNMIVYATQRFDCEFTSVNGSNEFYTGSIEKIGVDLSIKKNFTLAWTVLAPTDVAKEPGSLRGIYVGTGADIALGYGFGAKVLVGGGDNSFTLQPVSVAGVEGTGASLGLESFKLE